jgi:hypothetical protein
MFQIQLLFPILLILESFAAGIVYCFKKEYGSGVYWITAGILNLAVTFLIKKFG